MKKLIQIIEILLLVSVVLLIFPNKAHAKISYSTTQSKESAHKHNWITVDYKAATTKSDGKIYFRCSVCNKETWKVIPRVKKFSLSQTKFYYDGNSHKPTVTITDRNGKTIDKKHYTVEYSYPRVNYELNYNYPDIYTVTITFNSQKYSGTKKLQYVIAPKIVTNISTKNVDSTFATINWKQPIAANYAEIRYSTNKDMSSSKSVFYWSFIEEYCSCSIPELLSEKKYYYQVRSGITYDFETVYYGKWSSVKSFTTKKAYIKETEKAGIPGMTSQMNIFGNFQKNTLKYTSSNPSVVTVDKAGKLTMKNAGQATITATAGTHNFTCKVTVYADRWDFFDEYARLWVKFNISKSATNLEKLMLPSIFIRNSFYYVPEGDPVIMITNGGADCYAGATLLAAIYKAMGFSAQRRFAADDPVSKYPRYINFGTSHYNVEVIVNGSKYYVDATPGSGLAYLSDETHPIADGLSYVYDSKAVTKLNKK